MADSALEGLRQAQQIITAMNSDVRLARDLVREALAGPKPEQVVLTLAGYSRMLLRAIAEEEGTSMEAQLQKIGQYLAKDDSP